MSPQMLAVAVCVPWEAGVEHFWANGMGPPGSQGRSARRVSLGETRGKRPPSTLCPRTCHKARVASKLHLACLHPGAALQ